MISYLKAAANATCQVVLPMVGELLQHVPTVRHIKAGGAFIALGATFAGQAYFTKSLTADSPPLRKMRFISYAMAALFTGYGLFELICAVSTVWTHAKDQEVVSSVTSKLLECPVAKTLWSAVEKEGPIRVQISDNEVLSEYFWEETSRTINLKRTLTDTRKLIGTLYELCNAKQSLDFKALEKPLRTGELSFLAYAEKVVKIEWKSMLCHHEIAMKCIQSQHWQSETDYYRETCQSWTSADAFWKNYLAARTNANHFQDMMQEWAKNALLPFCRKNPLAVECKALR